MDGVYVSRNASKDNLTLAHVYIQLGATLKQAVRVFRSHIDSPALT
jgi:hypothetical protein